MEMELVNFGIGGCWLAYMIWKEKTHFKEFKESINNNTKVMHELQVVIASTLPYAIEGDRMGYQ